MKRRNPLSHEARELALFIENDGDLYRQQTVPIILNLARKIKRGIFSHVKAAKLFRYLADNGAKKYSAEFDTPQSGVTRSNWQRYKGFGAFSTRVRQETAKHLLRYYFQAIRERAGELKGKKNPNGQHHKTVQGRVFTWDDRIEKLRKTHNMWGVFPADGGELIEWGNDLHYAKSRGQRYATTYGKRLAVVRIS